MDISPKKEYLMQYRKAICTMKNLNERIEELKEQSTRGDV